LCPLNFFQPGEEKSECGKCGDRYVSLKKGSVECTKRVGLPLRQPDNLKLETVPEDNAAVQLTWDYDTRGATSDSTATHSMPDVFQVRVGHDRQFVTGWGVLVQTTTATNASAEMSMVIRFAALNESDLEQPTATSTAAFYTNYSKYTLWLQPRPTFISVRAYKRLPEVEGPWSASTSPWPLAASCGDDSFLNTSNHAAASENLANASFDGNDPTAWTCEDCPPGAACRGRTVWPDVRARFGWWRIPWSPGNGTVFERCPFEEDCEGYREDAATTSKTNASKTDVDAEEGEDASISVLADPDFRMQNVVERCKYGTQGVLCNACIRGYTRDGLACAKCSEEGFGVRLAIVVGVIALVGAFMSCCKRRLKIGKWKRYRSIWRDVLRIFSINVTFSQIGSSLSSVIDVDWPPNFLSFLKNLNFVNIDLMSLIGASCVGDFSFIVSFSCMTALPVAIVLFAFLEFHWERCALRRKLINMTGVERARREEEALHLLFKIADSDNSGHIDPAETKNILMQLGWSGLDLELAVQLMRRIDAQLDERGGYILTESE
jgi:hypothetical protein